MPRFTIAEPHPTVSQNAYTHSGRGGAGNYFRAPATTPASGISTTTSSPPPPSSSTATKASSSSRFYSGRGGAGNAHVAEARPVMSFDDELRLQGSAEQKRVGYVGRGGAGNIFDTTTAATSAFPGSKRRKDSDGASSTSSASGSFIERVSGVFARR